MPLQSASDAQWKRLRTDVGRLVARRIASSADVDDIVQEVLIRVWRHRGRLRDDERFGGWLSRLVSNAVVDHLRSRGARQAAQQRVSREPAGGEADSPAVKQLIAAVLRPFIDQLPVDYREVVILSELEGLTHAAIASRLSMSVSGIKSRVQRGRRLLRELLERCCAFALDVRGAPVSCVIRPDGELPPGCCAGSPDGGDVGCTTGPGPAGRAD